MESLLSKFEDFYSLSDIEQKKLLDEILATANENPNAFKAFVNKVDFGLECPLPYFYEALSSDLENWGYFFVDEFKRLNTLAKGSNEPKKYLNYLSEFSYIKPEEFKERIQLVQLALAELKNERAIFRYYAYELLFDLYIEGDDSLDQTLAQSLNDTDWRIRYWNYLSCKDFDILPKNYKLSFADRLKVKLLDTLKY